MKPSIVVSRTTAAIIALAILCGLAYLGARGGGFVALTASGGFQRNGEYPTTNPAAVASARYGSWSGADSHTGTLTSLPFRAGFAVSLAYAGYPAHAGEQIRLERVDGRGTQPLALDNAGESWTHVTVPVPPSWFGQRIRLVATDEATGFQGWIGVADVQRASAFQALGSDVRVRLVLLTLGAALAFLPCLSGALLLCRRAALPSLFLFSAALLIAGIVAELQFFVTMWNTTSAIIFLIALTAFGCVSTIIALRDADVRAALRRSDTWMPFALTLAVAMAYVACVDVTVTPNASSMALLPLLNMPSDDALPHILALHIAGHAPPEPFVGDWLSSDRPPLQAGFDLLGDVLAPFVSDVWTRYEAIGLVLQATIFGLLYTLCRALKLGPLRSLGIVALAACSGFFFVNTVYVWPKMLSASYVAIAMAIPLAAGPVSRLRASGMGAAIALALLSHGGVAFTLPPLLVALVVMKRFDTVRILVAAAACAIVLLAPWSWYQHVYDPPGDRLEKWHLAGHVEKTDTPLTRLLIDAYTTVPFSTIVANKASNVRTLWGDPLPKNADREFFFVRYAMSALLIPFIAAALLAGMRRFRSAGALAWISIGSLAFWCLAMYLPNQTIVHQGSYLTMALMFLAGGIVATEWWPIFAVVFVAQLADFMTTWLAPFSASLLFTIGGLTTFAVCAGALGLIAWAAMALRPPAAIAADGFAATPV